MPGLIPAIQTRVELATYPVKTTRWIESGTIICVCVSFHADGFKSMPVLSPASHRVSSAGNAVCATSVPVLSSGRLT